ncbi:hypothetical protein ABEB36_004200 [Hypothenemus hampei]|uniref:Nuclear pore complex protein n=1 Tax=Hypothenemus hampei TaxID=57062 RepID=A0ABD1F2K6_HYPHA
MDNNLNRSVRLLEDTLSTPGRGMFKKSLSRQSLARKDLSCTFAPHELEMIQNQPSFYDDTMRDWLNTDNTITGAIIQNENPWKSTVDNMFVEFFEILNGQSGSEDALEIVSELANCCSDVLKVIRSLESKVAVKNVNEEKWLEKERDTWRLLFILFQDRLMTQNLMEEDLPLQYFGKSEKKCVENLFKREHLIRECQLVIDWLEAGASEKDDEVLHFSDATVGWENTLHQLQSADTIAFSSSRAIVTEMDPDAPHYQKKPLHDIDMDDEKRLSKRLFKEIRCGKLEQAQKLARQCGHSWKAAIFEGWHLFHNANVIENNDSNGDQDSEQDGGYVEMDSDEIKEIEGNSSRDIWKFMALRYVKQDWINPYEKAAIGAFCGSINPVLSVCNSWEDYLWTYMRSLVDIRVESEIRDCCNKYNGYQPLPDDYWLQKMSLNQVFENLESCKNKSVRDEAKESEHMIQKYIILDEITTLLNELQELSESANVSTQFLRFIAHIALFLDQIGQANRRDCVEKVLEAYIKRLMLMMKTQLVAFYVSKLSLGGQIYFYARHLEQITEHKERKEALNYAEECELDVLAITKRVVENVRMKPEEFDQTLGLQKKLTETDKEKISAIDWLTFYESQRVELLIQSNAIIFYFLLLGKLDAAQLAFNKIPCETIGELTAELGDTNEEVNSYIKEHLSYKAYLEAYEAFNEWFKELKNKPVAPDELPEAAQFAEKVAQQHKVSKYKAEVERWKLATTRLANTARTLLYNILLFPGGWLKVARDSDHLRKTILPEVTFLLCSVLIESEMYEQCVLLADIIASEQYCLYKEFTAEQISKFLTKIAEASLAMTQLNKDPWGNELIL